MDVLYSRLLISLSLPVTMTILVPVVILWSSASSTLQPSKIVLPIGITLILIGLFILIQTIKAFVSIGRGTLAPWDSPEKLVVSGMYCYVRNPMISGVVIIILGESLVFSSKSIFDWCAIFFVFNMLYFVFIEEPQLTKKFGNKYVQYKKNVPRWIPRFFPWKPESNH